MAIFKHKNGCPASIDKEALCICEGSRYFYAFLVGVAIVIPEYAVGSFFGSEAIKGDAWHLAAGDMLYDLIALFIVALVQQYPPHEHTLRSCGGYAQSILLFIAAGFAYWELAHATPESPDLVMLLVGVLTSLGSWWRFRVLHPHGGPVSLILEIWRAVRSGSREVTTYVGEVLHVLTDFGTNVIVAVGGLLGLLSLTHAADEYASLAIIALLIISAVVVLIFSTRHLSHHHQ